jgi:hypothetical protein
MLKCICLEVFQAGLIFTDKTNCLPKEWSALRIGSVENFRNSRKNLARDKQSSLFCPTVCDEEKKPYIIVQV